MMGINISGLTSAINKNNMYYDAIDADAKKMVANLNDLKNLYSGNDLQFLFQDLVAQVNDVSLIPMIVKNYSDVLKDVETSYKAQDTNLKDQINHISTKTNM